MIRLQKGKEPEILETNGSEWTKTILEMQAVGENPKPYQKSRYNHEEVKQSIIEETNGKCAYCESNLLHIAFGDIEHIKPKKERPDLWFVWSNLTLACSICNNRKRNYHDDQYPLIDPYEDEPEGRLLFFGPLVRAAIGDVSAEMTQRILDLNREQLIERRTERLDHLRAHLEVLKSAPDSVKQVLRDDFLKEIGPDKEYTAMSRTVARQFGFLE